MQKSIDYWDIVPNTGIGEFHILDTWDKVADYLKNNNISYVVEQNIAYYSIRTENMLISFDKDKCIFAISVFNDFKGKINNSIGLNSTLKDVENNLGEYCNGLNEICPTYELKSIKGVEFKLSDDEKYDNMDFEWDETIVPIVEITVWKEASWKKQTSC
ncbi:MAG: hypothetical protein J1F03_00645 [Oscillospiraceae bacterium]|nr:hypothetical protein [Oscillospiraceae bacterium]